jgi:hypothetical protein
MNMKHTPLPDPWNGCLRQIHLDFHNSPWIDDLLCDFDAAALARRFKEAHVNSVVVFTKCVHGMGYYPSKVVEPHPALNGRDFTGEMVEALHREGIRAPLYTIMGWEENLAQLHPDWMQICEDGTYAQNAFASDGKTQQPGRYRWLNFLHPDYQDYFEAHLNEILDRYPCDGLFLDMLVMHPDADWSDHAIAFREKHGLMGRDALTHARYEAAAQAAFADKFTPIIQAKAPNASIFYNAENRLFVDGSLGALARAEQQTHFEIESLPSGMWSYNHFPRVARNLRSRKPWLGMTGRFQKMWGDFGAIKPTAALEYECFRSQALGGANSVGDQLGPRGTLDEGAYNLIGDVFAQLAAAEPFYEGCEACPKIAILCPHHPDRSEHSSTLVEEAMLRLCEELHYDCVIVNDQDDLSGYDLLILGEGTSISAALQKAITDYVQNGGKLLASGDSVFKADGTGWGPFSALRCEGQCAFAPAYWRARAEWQDSLGTDDRVVYARGLRVIAADTIEVRVDRVAPYFQRSDLKFCSHFQAPPRKETLGEPAVLQGEGWIYFADPLFSDYRQSANLAVLHAMESALRALIGPPRIGEGLPTTLRSYPLRKGNDLHLTLLHYIPERKAEGSDIVAERLGFDGYILQLPPQVRTVIQEPGNHEHAVQDGKMVLPRGSGRLLLRVVDYFTDSLES